MRSGPTKPIVCLILVGAVAAGAHVHAQTVTTAGLKGRVLDHAGDGIPGVLLTLTNPTTAIGAQEFHSDTEGNYIFKLLPPASGYTLKVAMPGFATVIAGPLDLSPGRITVQNITLKTTSELEETVKVEARGEIVDTSSAKTSSTFNAEFIEGLPLIGRNFQDILTLAPGVTDSDGDGNPNVRGARDTGLQLRIDGTNATDPLTGHFGQAINLETIEEIEVITGGASAEYSRAEGGFANIITKSGGNSLSGSAKIFFRSHFFDGDGANNQDRDPRADTGVPSFSDTDLFLTVGGAVVRDHLWYFTSVERLDHELPVPFPSGGGALHTEEGWRTFAKMTWQANADNKLALQLSYDPLELTGNYLGVLISPETDVLIRTGGPLSQLKWTSIISPMLLLEALVSQSKSGVSLLPVSNGFRSVKVDSVSDSTGATFYRLPCETRNCSFERHIYTLDNDQVETGPFPFQSEDDRDRTTMKADLSYTIEDRLGSHALKTGFEINDERYEGRLITNPEITDGTTDWTGVVSGRDGPFGPDVRFGTISIEVPSQTRQTLTAVGFVFGGYVQESWKPRPNLTVNAGLRYDHEEIDTRGLTPFDPLAERREVLRRFDILCEEADAEGTNCVGLRMPGQLDFARLPGTLTPQPGSPALQFDLDGDGVVELLGPEGRQVTAPFTTPTEVQAEGFRIANGNLAPRFSVSWDPWADGKTKLFGTWNKYYDRITLGQ
ncbi:MAG TPA: TonB-dependent receptor, partial [Candidatus Polarisedimenticolia bacterium]|nr:TonB-dependent receptor [Candidatus Polarisedimenticolia bacterium]